MIKICTQIFHRCNEAYNLEVKGWEWIKLILSPYALEVDEKDLNVVLLEIEGFSNDHRENNGKLITPTNHKRKKQPDESIRIPSNYP